MSKNILKVVYAIFSVLFLVGTLNSAVVCAQGEKVFVLPDDGRQPFLDIIKKAQHTLYMAAYKFKDEKIIQALLDAAKRGVQISLLTEPNIYKREELPADKQDLESPAPQLDHPNIHIFVNVSPRFGQSHYRMILADDKIGVITTANFMSDSFEKGPYGLYRNFAISVSDSAEVESIKKVFLADIADQRIVPDVSNIIWGPEQQRMVFLEMINGAKESISIYQQDVQDMGLAQAIAGAARAGVEVRLIMNPFPFHGKVDNNIPNQALMAEAGVKVGLCDMSYRVIQARTLVVDGKKMYLGTCNFYTPSIDQTREIGKLTTDPKSIATVMKTFEEDWKHGKPFVPPAKS